jgi:gliding motility-associated-like protein
MPYRTFLKEYHSNSIFPLILLTARNFIIKLFFISVLIWIGNPCLLRAQFTLGGNASNTGNGCFQLTAASNSQKGYVYQNAPLNLHEPFDYRFSVYLGSNNGGADGIVFVLRGTLGTPYIGNGGGAIGFDGSGFTNCIGIEVDTYYNGGYSDMTNDHIGIFKNGPVDHGTSNSLAGPVQASATSGNVEDGNYHTLNVRWDPAEEELSVYLDCDYRLLYEGDLIDSIFQGDSLVHWGFLGTTGGASNVQGFCFTVPIDSFITELVDTTICVGESAQLNAGSSALGYSWSPSTGLSSTSVGNPYASPNATQTYIVSETYQCDTLYDTVTVTVLQPNFTVSAALEDPLCKFDCNGEIDLTVTGGSGGYGYFWNTTATAEDISGLCAGTYSVTITDTLATSSTYACTITDNWTLTEPPLLTVSTTNPGETSCPDGATCDAQGLAVGAGGTTPYSFLWSSGESSAQAWLLCAGTNTVTVTDNNGCDTVAYIQIGIPDTIKTKGLGDTQICITNFAAIAATSTGGTPPYAYVWTEGSQSGPVVSTYSNTTVNPSITTTYYVQSTDINGCPGDTSKVLVKVRPPLGSEIPKPDTICPYDTHPITVTGTGGDSIYTYAWSTGLFGPTIAVSPDTSFWYFVTVSDLCGSPVFVDSVYQQVGGYNPIKAEIRAEDDSLCPGESIYLIARGYGGFKGPEEYRYQWAHTTDTNRIQFVRPSGTKKFAVSIKDLCLSKMGRDTITIFIDEAQAPELEALPEESCAKNDVEIRVKNRLKGYHYSWVIDSSTVIETKPADTSFYKQFTDAGCHHIKLEMLSEFDCYSEKNFPCIVKVLEQPVANFDHFPENPTSVNPQIQFRNRSKNANHWIWFYDATEQNDVEMFFHEFNDFSTEYLVELVAISKDNCTDTIRKNLEFIEETTIYYPNSFTPDGDGVNDEFFIVGEAIDLQDFDLVIFDRWGHQVFRTTNRTQGWNGTATNGKLAPTGVYSFRLSYRDRIGEQKVAYDEITISYTGTPTGLK